MRVYGNKDKLDIAYVDIDIIAFHVDESEVEVIADYLAAAITTRCLMDFGQAPEIE